MSLPVLKFNDETRTRIILDDIRLSLDPEGSTVDLKIDGTWYPAEWLGTPVNTPTTERADEYWTQSARTAGYFRGPAATADGSTLLALGQHNTEIRVTQGQDVLVRPTNTIEVY